MGPSCASRPTRGDAWLGFTAVGSIEDALELDPRDRSSFAGSPHPLFVVCTHGRRDPCCAERGRPLVERLAASFPDLTWESTHVGGDRFAGNLVAFPHGLYHGRVEPDEGPEIAHGYGEGRIARLDRYRGRSSDPFHVQAAEHALRDHLGLDRIDAVTPERSDRRGDRAEVVFATVNGPHRVRLERTLGAPMRLTCHASHEARPARVARARDRTRSTTERLDHEPTVDGDAVARTRRSMRADHDDPDGVRSVDQSRRDPHRRERRSRRVEIHDAHERSVHPDLRPTHRRTTEGAERRTRPLEPQPRGCADRRR